MTGSEIANAIEEWRANIPYSCLYIGITDNIKERLFGYHKVQSRYIYQLADTESLARDLEKFFLAKGMKGGTGGGKRPTYVYVYVITKNTIQ